MPAEQPQTYENHRRFVPLYHFAIFGVFAGNLLWSLVRVARWPSFETGFGVLMALALLGIFFYLRIFALTVQDRVIRLEMRLRLRQVLPADLAGRTEELDRGQLIALRFASDEELPDLVRDVLTNNIRDRDTIKKKIQNWQADSLRC